MNILIEGYFSKLLINHRPLALIEKTIKRIAPCKVYIVVKKKTPSQILYK